MDFQTFRNNLHHDIKRNELQTILEIIKRDDVEYYRKNSDYIRMFYLVATIDYISKKYSIPLCNKYDEIREMKLEEPFFVGDAKITGRKEKARIEEFAKYNIIEGDLYDAV